MNDERVIAALMDLAEAYPSYRLTDRTVAKYLQHLADLPDDVIEAACNAAVTQYKWFPSVAELRSLVTDAAIDQEWELDRAWVEVQAEARRVGYNRLPEYRGGIEVPKPTPQFSTPLVEQAVASVGWRTICLADNTKGEISEQFKRAYRRVLKSAGRAVQQGTAGGDLRHILEQNGSVITPRIGGGSAHQLPSGKDQK